VGTHERETGGREGGTGRQEREGLMDTRERHGRERGSPGERGMEAWERQGPACARWRDQRERERDQRERDRDWHTTAKDRQAADGAMRERTSVGERDQQA
jgi:hypothetical protein